MRKRLIGAAALAAVLLLPFAAQAPHAEVVVAPTAPTVRARVIVKYRPDSLLLKMQAQSARGRGAAQVQSLGQRIGIALKAGYDITDRAHVVFADGMSSSELAARIAAESDIEYAVPDERKHIVAEPNDSFYATRAYNDSTTPTSGGPLVGQWYLKPQGPTGSPANTAPSSINAERAWDLTTGSGTVVIADIDTGLRFDHPDLQSGNILPGYDMVGQDNDGSFTTANDGNGRDSDASDPGDWVTQAEVNAATNQNDPLHGCMAEDSSWHGTQTAGLMGAATGNGAGISSVGFGNVKVMPVRALGKCGGFDSDIQAAMLWAAGIAVPGVPNNTTPAKVLSMSLGSSGNCSAAYQDVVNQVIAKGSVIVVAAGNGDSSGIGTSVGTPANCTGVIAVAALRSEGDKVGFSDLGPEVGISAPGGNCVNTANTQPCLYPMMTTSNSGKTTPTLQAQGGIYTDSFNRSLGTSFSTPLVSGTVALMLSVQPALTPLQVLAKLQSSAQPFPTKGGSATGQTACVAASATNSFEQGECYCVVGLCGAGMLNAHAAVLAALGLQAVITDSTQTVATGTPVVLTSTSVVGSGGSISAYVWTVTSAGTTGVTITSGQGTSTLTLLPHAAGSFNVSLTVTDTLGATSTGNATVSVVAATTSGGGGASDNASSGGGGALGAGWLMLLLGAVAALASEDGLQRRRRAGAAIASVAAARRD